MCAHSERKEKLMQIEKVTIEDAKELVEIYRPYVEETAVSFEYVTPSPKEFAERIRTISENYPYLKAVENGSIIGYAYAAAFKSRAAYDWSVETTVYVRRDCRGRGVGHALYKALEQCLSRMGILNMNACIAALPEGSIDKHLTDASIFFHKKFGFDMVGRFHNSGYKFDTWYDMVWMEKQIGEHKCPQDGVRLGSWKDFDCSMGGE